MTVTNGIYVGSVMGLSNPQPYLIATTVASTPVNLNYTGSMANQFIYQTAFTDIKTDGSAIGAWVTSTSYVVGNCVANGGSFYRCLIAHTSGTFATDLANGDWTLMNLQPLLAQYWTTPNTLTRTAGIANMAANSFVGF